MPQFAANLTMMYPELPFLDRFEAAAKDGFTAVEYLFPYAWPAAELAARLKLNGLRQVLFNAPPGGTDAASIAAAWDSGSRGIACVPGRGDELAAGMRLALDYAEALDCPRIHLMAGCVPASHDAAAVRDTYVDNVLHAAELARAIGRQVLLEPINTRDMPGFFLNRQQQAHDIVEEIGLDNLKVQMDLYHCQIVEGDVATKLRTYLPTGRVGHIQIAGVPERHEPDIGELHYPYLFTLIDELLAQSGLDIWIGAEYRPRHGGEPGGTSRGLGWFAPWRRVS